MLAPWLGVRAYAPDGTRATTHARTRAIRWPCASQGARRALGRLLAVRLFAAARVGFGDTEALYATYALHPQPAYLDHPGLIGVFARVLGGGTAPDPAAAHLVTALLATLVPVAPRSRLPRERRDAGARSLVHGARGRARARDRRRPLRDDARPAARVPVDGGARPSRRSALRSRARRARAATLAFAGAGLLAGVAAASKVTGLLLLPALVVDLRVASRARRTRAPSRPGPGSRAGLLVLAPIASFEARTGWPMLVHRLVDTQSGAGLSLRNCRRARRRSARVPLAARGRPGVPRGAGGVARPRRTRSARCFWRPSRSPPLVLVPLALWSRVAEPHWVAPALLALGPAIARGADGPVERASSSRPRRVAAACVAAVHAWVLVPQALRSASRVVRRALRPRATSSMAGRRSCAPCATRSPRRPRPGSRTSRSSDPTGSICAQLAADLQGRRPRRLRQPRSATTSTPGGRARSGTSRSRSSGSPTTASGRRRSFPSTRSSALRKIRIKRADRVVRTFTIAVFLRRAEG